MKSFIRSLGKRLIGAAGYEFLRNGRGGIVLPRGVDWFSWQRGVHRAMFRKHLQQVLKARAIDLVIDVGANVGQYGQGLRELGYTGDIISFEPAADLFSRLQQTAQGDARWRVKCCALGEETGTVTFNRTRNPLLCSVLTPGPEYTDIVGSGMDIVATEQVELRRLDDLWEECTEGLPNRRIMLKMDTQGYNAQVFAGVREHVHEIQVLQSELSAGDLYLNAASMLEELGVYQSLNFRVSCIYPLTITKKTRNVIEYDCILTSELVTVPVS